MSIILGEEKDLTIVLGDFLAEGNEFDLLGDGVEDEIIRFTGEMIVEEQDSHYIVYGDMRNLTFDLNALNYSGVRAIDRISGFTFEFGYDLIDLSNSNGNNLLHGDMRDLSMSITGGFASDGAFAVSQITDNNFLLGNDEILSGDGNNIVYGDLRDFNVLVTGGKSTDEGTFHPSAVGGGAPGFGAGNKYIMGHDTISLGNGNNEVYGDLRDWTVVTKDPKAFDGGQTTSVYLIGEDFLMGADTITLGDGQNLVYGDVRNIFWLAKGGLTKQEEDVFSSQVDIGRVNAIMGSDEITVGDGGNSVFGDAHDITFKAEGGVNAASGEGVPSVLIFLNTIEMAADKISAGSGADSIYGDMHDLLIEATAGTATLTNAVVAIIRNNFIMGDELGDFTIEAGAGDDLVSGDLNSLTLLAEGGLATSGLRAFSVVHSNVFEAGDDKILAEDGNDTVYGDMQLLSMIAQGGTVNNGGGNAEGAVLKNIITMGNDELLGGNGNDILYGDLETASFVAIDGTDNSGGLGGVSGLFSGDLFGIVDTGNIITFGDDNLTGGTGDDILVGDVANLIGADDFLTGLNEIIFGADHFIYDGDIDNGDDVILDFDTNLDVLESVNMAEFSDGGLNADGYVIVEVSDAGLSSTITLVGVTDYDLVVTM